MICIEGMQANLEFISTTMQICLWFYGLEASFDDVHARGDNRGQFILIEVWNHRLMRDWQISCQGCQIDFTATLK